MRKKYQSYRILSARTVSATHPRIFLQGGGGGGSTTAAPTGGLGLINIRLRYIASIEYFRP